MKKRIKRALKEYNLIVCSALLWFRIGKYFNQILWWEWTLRFHTEWRRTWKAEDLKKNWKLRWKI